MNAMNTVTEEGRTVRLNGHVVFGAEHPDQQAIWGSSTTNLGIIASAFWRICEWWATEDPMDLSWSEAMDAFAKREAEKRALLAELGLSADFWNEVIRYHLSPKWVEANRDWVFVYSEREGAEGAFTAYCPKEVRS